MKIDQSYGVIPLQKKDDVWHVFLIQLHAGHWGFPKGHSEQGETPMQTASRELLEETGLMIRRFLSEKIFEETYFFRSKGDLVKKNVGYFIAEVEGKVVMQAEELAASQWVPFARAEEFLTFVELKKLLHEVYAQFKD